MNFLYNFKIIDFFNAQESWTREKIKAAPENSMWSVVALIMAQFDGIKAGYAAAQKEDASLSTLEPYVWQSKSTFSSLNHIIICNEVYKQMVIYLIFEHIVLTF